MQTIYTRCDRKIEEEGKALTVEAFDLCQNCSKFYESTVIKLLKLQDKLWVLSQKYLILKNGIPHAVLYPADITACVQNELLQEWFPVLQDVKKQLRIFKRTLDPIARASLTLKETARKIENESQLRKNLFLCSETFDELIKRFRVICKDMRKASMLLVIEDVAMIECFKEILEVNKNFFRHFVFRLKSEDILGYRK